MSSSLDGAADVVGGLLALTAGAAVGAVFGTGWLLYASGKLVADAITGVDRAVADKVQRDRLERQLRTERAENARTKLQKMQTEFIAEARADIKKIRDPHIISRMEALIDQIRQLQRESSSTGQLESQNASIMARLQEAVREKNALLQQAKLPPVSMGQYALSEFMADIMCELRAAAAAGEIVGENVAVMTAEQLERIALRERFNEAVLRVRAALENEDRRAHTYPVSAKRNASLHRLFDGIAQRVAMLNDPTATNKELQSGLHRLEQLLDSYDLIVHAINDEEAEFTTIYPVYCRVQAALELPVKKPHQFADLDALKAEMELLKAKIQRAQQCAAVMQHLGQEAYMCLAFDTEMTAMGYTVLESRQLMDQMRRELRNHTCKSNIPIPAYDLPEENGVTQMYTVDESCRLQLIVREDGTTTLQTIMHGNDSEQTVQAQKKHCARASELVKRLQENWFIKCGLQEMAPPETVTQAAIGAAEDPAARLTQQNQQHNDRVMHQK